MENIESEMAFPVLEIIFRTTDSFKATARKISEKILSGNLYVSRSCEMLKKYKIEEDFKAHLRKQNLHSNWFQTPLNFCFP